MRFKLQTGGQLEGQIRVAGDKSISHRCIMLGSISDGVSEISGFLEGDDALATRRAFEQMGVKIEDTGPQALRIHGVGKFGLKAPADDIDLGNSGTAMRLMIGLLSGQAFDSCLVGDASLSSRPMGRVAMPLSSMGASIKTQDGCAPINIQGGKPLHGIDYSSPVASAQVKSAILLAGLYAQGATRVVEPGVTRDHTERMLRGFGCDVSMQDGAIVLQEGAQLKGMNIEVPADISSAAFFMVGACIAKDSELLLTHVGVNETRDGVLSILKAMGADIQLQNPRTIGGEPVADVLVRSSKLKGIEVSEQWVPLAIDEFPAIAIAAACADGVTVISGAHELRVKECDRIAATAHNLRAMGIEVTEQDDGMTIFGGGQTDTVFNGAVLKSFDDHRIAMAASLAALRSKTSIEVEGVDNVATSFPNYVELMQLSGLRIEQFDD